MKHAIELIKELFDSEEWKYDYDEDDKVFVTGINMNSVLGSLRIHIFMQETSYLVYASLQATAEEKCYSKISEYLHRANYGLRNGNFEFNYGSGEIRYKIFVDFENRELSKDVVARSIFMPIFMFDRYGRGLIKLMLNEGNPEELIEDAEKDHPEEEERTESSSQ